MALVLYNLMGAINPNEAGMSTGIRELRNKEDFLDIDPECVETAEFYGGNFSSNN